MYLLLSILHACGEKEEETGTRDTGTGETPVPSATFEYECNMVLHKHYSTVASSLPNKKSLMRKLWQN